MPKSSERERRLIGIRFGEQLRLWRITRNLSQEELGLKAELHRTEIGMLERGVRLPRIDTLNRLAGSLDVEPGELLLLLPRYRPPAAPPAGTLEDR